ncbi:hypothetical protein L7F22_066178 [Adiantum nelumboides]|nr:hypothetical protein [Adiantum nelumboides]
MYSDSDTKEVDNNYDVETRTEKEAEAVGKMKNGMPNWLFPDNQEIKEWNLGSESDPKMIKINKLLKKELKDKAWNLFLKFNDVFAWEHSYLKGVDPESELQKLQETHPTPLGGGNNPTLKDADSPKDAWDNLIAFNATNTRARKIQLKNELNKIKKGDLSVNGYTLNIKALCESLSSIGVAVDDDDKVEACLHGLGNAYKQFKTNICTRENIPHFLELSSLLVVQEKSFIDDGAIQTGRNSSKQALWTGSRRGRGRNAQRGGRGNQG